MEDLELSNLFLVMAGTTIGAIVGAIIGVALHKHFTEKELVKAGCILVAALYCAVLVSIVIRYFLSGYGGLWGFVPALLMSVSSYFLTVRPMEEKFGQWAAMAITLAAAGGSMSASWNHTPLLTVTFLMYVCFLIAICDKHGQSQTKPSGSPKRN